jgi:light-regulated signal transduction histidine kinase (bacteriophytochrome)
MLTGKYRKMGGRLSEMGRFIPARTKSGKEIIVNGSLNTFRDDNRNLVIVILQDVTELKRNQDTIIKQNESLKSIAWLQSHELRRPLANILGFCNLFESDVELEISDVKKLTVALSESAKELDQVIHDIVEKTELKK